jgi:hypothetical protein
MRGRGLQPLRYLGLLLGLLCLLAGCGSNDGSSTTSGTASRSRQLSLQVQLSSELASQVGGTSQHQELASAQVRQVQPGDPGFIARLEVRLQARGSDLVSPQVFTLNSTQQETATLDVTVPGTVLGPFQVLVSAFTSQEIEVFRGSISVMSGQTSVIVPLLRAALVPVPATAANLQQTTFTFTDGAIFGLANIPVTLATGTFVGNVGDFALTAKASGCVASGCVVSGSVTSGSVTSGSCTFLVATSTFPAGQGIQAGDRLVLDPCQVDAIDRRLIATRALVSLTPGTSSPPVVAPSNTTLNLPSSIPTLVIDEDTSGALQVAVSLSGPRPANLTLSVTIPPAHGTATLDTNTGVVTYTPVRDFNGSDRVVVTVVVTFTDNDTPALLLGTVMIPITVRPVNDAPVLTSPGNQASAEGATVALRIVASDVDGDTLSFSATNLPPGLSINAATGLISGTVAAGAAATSPYPVTVTVSDGLARVSIAFAWNIVSSVVPINIVRISPPVVPVMSGTSFAVSVAVNTAATNVFSYLLELRFDPSVVMVTNITQGSPLFEAPITNLGTPLAASGIAKFAANNPTFAPANGALTLATITFQVIGSPGMTSPLKLQFPPGGVLVDSNFQAIGGIMFVDGLVTVN